MHQKNITLSKGLFVLVKNIAQNEHKTFIPFPEYSRHVCVQYESLEKILVDLITIGKCFLTLAAFELEVTDNIYEIFVSIIFK